MASVIDTSQWITFFTKAGLPPNVAANYALIFSDNRIQLNMLMDLSKEYLYDMGIKVMGDVIAILRYAKEFHTQLAKERVIGNTTSPNKSTVAVRMVGHYTRPSPNRSFGVQNETQLNKKSTVISLKKRPASSESVAKKIRRVPPEEEGAYKIKMPLGTTEKTRKILQQQQLAQGIKRSVFSRLGDSAVSSSTDSNKNSSVFERLGPSSKNNSDDIPTSTVSNEMDAKTNKAVSPLQYRGVLKMTVGKKRTVSTDVLNKGNVSSRTVFKPGQLGLEKITKTVNLNRINTILQSNKPHKKTVVLQKGNKPATSHGIFGRSIISQNVGVKSRLGKKIDARNLARTKILVRTSQKVAPKTAGVFTRLGR